MKRYDLFEYISQREIGTMPCENEKLVLISNVIRNATADCRRDEAESECSNDNVKFLINEREKRIATQDNLIASDLFPKNVLKDPTGDLFVIDLEISLTADE